MILMSGDAAYQALLAHMNQPKGTQMRLLGILPALDAAPLVRDFSGPLWLPCSVIGGKKGQTGLQGLFSGSMSMGFPAPTSLSEFAQMNTAGVEAGNFVGAAPVTPMASSGGSGIEMA